jgi:acyl-CoA synthetase (NDP forming)
VSRPCRRYRPRQTAFGLPDRGEALHLGLTHKTETGGVALDLTSASAAEAAAQRIRDCVAERMVERAVTELIVGVKRDAQFGLCLVVGAGGVWLNCCA